MTFLVSHFYVNDVDCFNMKFITIFKYFLFCFERSELDWELAVDPRGELFYIESDPLEKARHNSAEVVEKADTPKFLGKLHQNRHTTRGLSVKTAELLLLVLTGFFCLTCNRDQN